MAVRDTTWSSLAGLLHTQEEYGVEQPRTSVNCHFLEAYAHAPHRMHRHSTYLSPLSRVPCRTPGGPRARGFVNSGHPGRRSRVSSDSYAPLIEAVRICRRLWRVRRGRQRRSEAAHGWRRSGTRLHVYTGRCALSPTPEGFHTRAPQQCIQVGPANPQMFELEYRLRHTCLSLQYSLYTIQGCAAYTSRATLLIAMHKSYHS
eukprot:366000-Chlamydomonas_euryale.AAC.44